MYDGTNINIINSPFIIYNIFIVTDEHDHEKKTLISSAVRHSVSR